MTKALWTVLVAGILVVPAWAQNADDGDDPDHGVARVSLLNGDVNVQRGDSGEVVAAELNAPLVALDHLLTGANSRAELQFDYANMIRLGPVSEVRIGELKDNDYFIQVAEGTTTFRMLRDSNARIEISTPTVSIRPTQQGIYRITVRPDGATEVTVRSGQAEISTPKGVEVLRSGKTLQARGTAQDPDFMILSAIGRDDWDTWNENRDRDLDRGNISYQYVSNSVPGAQDLNGNGRWVYDSPYGWVWVPNVASTWAPYRVGRWSWVNYYGWTWISGDPWGWAPYHYGNWYSSPYGWAWYPGNTGYRYYYRPALVSFFGWGNGSFNLGVGFGGGMFGYGNIGWVPLAPYERYYPWYGSRFRGGYNNITVINNTNIINNYRNARQYNGRDGITSVQAGNFGRQRVDNGNFVRANSNDLQRAGRVQGPMGFNNQNGDSRRYSDRTPSPDVASRVNQTRDRQFSSVAANTDRSRRGGGQGNAGGAGGGNPTPNNGNGGNNGGNGAAGQGNRGNAVDRAGVNRGAPTNGVANDAPNNGSRRFDQGNASADRGSGIRDNGIANSGVTTRGADVRSVGAAQSSNPNSNPGIDTRSRRGVEFAPRSQQPSVDRGNSQPGNAQPGNTNIRGVGEGRNAGSAQNSTPNQGDSRSQREFAPRAQPNPSQPGSSDPFGGSRRGGGGSQPVQINPPIVRDRGNSAPQSAPRSVSPAQSAPQRQSAPPSNFGGGNFGGGGAIRGNGGGGGGGGAAPAIRGGGGGGGNFGGGGGGGNRGGGGGGGGGNRGGGGGGGNRGGGGGGRR